MSSPIVILGASGMLGHAYVRFFGAAGRQVLTPPRTELDLASTSLASLERLIKGASLVVCCAAWTDVDSAETHEIEATKVNGEGIGMLGAACASAKVPLVHFGTDYVFNGRAQAPYAPDAKRDPINAYGRSKAAGEVALENSGANYLHLRTSWLYAPWGKNFVRTMAKLTKEREALQVVDDQRGRPTSAEHLARTSLALFKAGARGVHHLSDGGECTWFELACFIRDHRHEQCEIAPCSSEAFPRPAPRPAYSVLDISTSEALVGPMGDWRENVANVLDRES